MQTLWSSSSKQIREGFVMFSCNDVLVDRFQFRVNQNYPIIVVIGYEHKTGCSRHQSHCCIDPSLGISFKFLLDSSLPCLSIRHSWSLDTPPVERAQLNTYRSSINWMACRGCCWTWMLHICPPHLSSIIIRFKFERDTINLHFTEYRLSGTPPTWPCGEEFAWIFMFFTTRQMYFVYCIVVNVRYV